MKVSCSYIILAVLFVAATKTTANLQDCSPEALGVLWPSYDDNTQYWQCTALHTPRTAVKCLSKNDWFSFYHQKCVPQQQWMEPPTNLLGRADRYAFEQQKTVATAPTPPPTTPNPTVPAAPTVPQKNFV